MSKTKPSTTWAALRDSSTTAGSGSIHTTAAGHVSPPQPLQWKARGQHISQPAPNPDSFPALSSDTPNPAGHGMQSVQHRPQLQHPPQASFKSRQQQGTGQGKGHSATENHLRRRSLSAPSLTGALQPELTHTFPVVAGSHSASSSRSSSAEQRRHKPSKLTASRGPLNSTQQHSATTSRQLQTSQQQGAPVGAQQVKPLSPPQQQPGVPSGLLGQQQQQAHPVSGMQLLQECHPWCDAVLLHEVLLAVDGDVAAALDALQDMLPPSLPQPQAAAASNRSSSSSSDADKSTCGSEAEVATAENGVHSRSTPPCRTRAAAPTCSSGGAAAIAQQALQLHLQEEEQSLVRHRWPAGAEDEAAEQQQQQQQQQGSQGADQQQQEVAAGGDQDTYHAMRGDAVRLSHKWRKATRRAAAARARGDFSTAAQLLADAAVLKERADAAHAAAAIKIEVINNKHNPDGLWELDLHGLHVAEALQALQARVELLQAVAQDMKSQLPAPASSAPVPAGQHQHQAVLQQQGGVAAAGAVPGNRKQAVLMSLLLPDKHVLTWDQQLAAMRQELRVIVGKGLHSSGGEASLPRAVEQWLLRHGYRYIFRGGCLGVQLKLL